MLNLFFDEHLLQEIAGLIDNLRVRKGSLHPLNLGNQID